MTSRRDVEVALADHKDKLTFEWREDCVIITKPYREGQKARDEWGAITKIVQNELGGKWVRMGSDSHWVVPLEVEEKQEEQKQPEKPTESQQAEKKGNNGSFATLHCPHCGKRIGVAFRPEGEAS